MKPEKDKIKNVFGSKLQNFEPELPPLMWEKIDAGLSAQQQPLKSPARRVTLRKYSAAVASIAALIAIALLLFLPKNDNQPGSFAVNQDSKPEKTDLSQSKGHSTESTKHNQKPETTGNTNHQPVIHSENMFIASTDSPDYTIPAKGEESNQNNALTNVSKERLFGFNENQTVIDTDINKTFIAENNEPIDRESNPKHQTVEQFEQELGNKITDLEAYARRGEDLLADNNMPQDKKKNREEAAASNGFLIGAGGGGAFSKARAEQMQLRRVNYALADANKESDLLAGNSSMVNLYQRQQMKMKHNQPITFGISISKSVSKRVSLETGITYTYLSSRFESDGSSNLNANDYQHFHYLGVPLAINYKLLEWNKLQFYVTGGGQIQKDFYGRMKTTQNAPALENAQDSEKKNISQKHPQFSTNASLGLSYPLYSKLALYTNVGAAYYFDADNEYETIYSDRKWQLNLNLGMKFEF